MEKTAYLVVGVLLGSLATGAMLGAEGVVGQDPMELSPQFYTVHVDNDRVRAMEYRLPPGASEPMHSHPAGLTYAVSGGTARSTLPDGTVSDITVEAGQVGWRDGSSHAFENIGQTEFHAIAIDIKPCGR